MFADRTEAGRLLGRALVRLGLQRPIVYGLPRGGVPVAFEVAEALGAPLDVVLVRKIGAPGQPELALGAVVDGPQPVVVWNEDVVRTFGLDEAALAPLVAEQRTLLATRRVLYAGHGGSTPATGRTAVLVDDGLATGATARAALRALRAAGATRVVLAVPVAPPETVELMRAEADDVVALETPDWFPGVGAFYDDFGQTEDAEVVDYLDRRRRTVSRETARGEGGDEH